jgi:predicted thioesterase
MPAVYRSQTKRNKRQEGPQMARFTIRLLFVSCMLPGLVAGAAACSSGPSTVNKSDIQNQINSKMTDSSGNKPDSVNCPNELNATVGAATDCDMTVKGQPFNVNVTVTSVDGDKVKFDMVETVDKAQVASEISDQLAQQVGHKPESVTCPDNLKGDTGATLQCELTDSGQTYGVNVTVTDVDAGDVKFDIKVDDQPKQ